MKVKSFLNTIDTQFTESRSVKKDEIIQVSKKGYLCETIQVQGNFIFKMIKEIQKTIYIK